MTVHDTHGQYSKMPKLTPAELSRMKADKDQQDSAIARQRAEEARQRQISQQQAQQQRLQQAATVRTYYTS